ncbi:MAG: hypothetical protein AAGK28_08565, partial [Pseudomonadota bacterium]
RKGADLICRKPSMSHDDVAQSVSGHIGAASSLRVPFTPIQAALYFGIMFATSRLPILHPHM